MHSIIMYRWGGDAYIEQFLSKTVSTETLVIIPTSYILLGPVGLFGYLFVRIFGVVRDTTNSIFATIFMMAIIYGTSFIIHRNLKRENFFDNLWNELKQMDEEELKRQTKYTFWTLILPMYCSPLIFFGIGRLINEYIL